MPKSRMCNFINWNYIWKLFLAIISVVLVCEYFIYYIVLLQCSWPQPSDALEKFKPVKAMLLADTHLLGVRNGHWFDKSRREWQMYRSFQTVMALHNPDVVFFLGDVFDEGDFAKGDDFKSYVDRFHNLFQTPEKTQVFVVAGNHDIGFHDATNQYLNDRFNNAFQASAVNLVTIEGNVFVLLNSMAMEGDNCSLCRPAEHRLKEISKQLHCDKTKPSNCTAVPNAPGGVRPILLLHMPLYRKFEDICIEPDSVPEELKLIENRKKIDCLSPSASHKLLKWLKPRLIVDGHVHHSCRRLHEMGAISEWTVASFSWRNKNNPSFLLATFMPNNFAISKCYLPQESTVITLYIISGIGLLLWIVITRRHLCKPSHYSKVS